jgi:hypothetical protein
MKISKTKLQQIIKEELRKVLGEGEDDDPRPDQGSTRLDMTRLRLLRRAQRAARHDAAAALTSAAPTVDVRKRRSDSPGPVQHPSFLPGEKAAVDFLGGSTERSPADVSQAFADRELGSNDEHEADDAIRQTYNLPNGWQDDRDMDPKKLRFYKDQYKLLLGKLKAAEFDR